MLSTLLWLFIIMNIIEIYNYYLYTTRSIHVVFLSTSLGLCTYMYVYMNMKYGSEYE